jgi:hypothetical protein
MPFMREFSLRTHWLIPAPIDVVWNTLFEVREWPTWWRHVEDVRQLDPGNADGIGARHRFIWRTRLPYRIRFDMRVTRLSRPTLIEGEASGDLDGVGCWTLRPLAQSTLVNYLWQVRASKPWMRRIAPLLYPMFVWNHNGVMQSGKKGLTQRLCVTR